MIPAPPLQAPHTLLQASAPLLNLPFHTFLLLPNPLQCFKQPWRVIQIDLLAVAIVVEGVFFGCAGGGAAVRVGEGEAGQVDCGLPVDGGVQEARVGCCCVGM